jgi:hypothetical protein
MYITTPDFFITSIKKSASDGRSSQPLGDWYDTKDGNPEGFSAHPVVGRHLGVFHFYETNLGVFYA